MALPFNGTIPAVMAAQVADDQEDAPAPTPSRSNDLDEDPGAEQAPSLDDLVSMSNQEPEADQQNTVSQTSDNMDLLKTML